MEVNAMTNLKARLPWAILAASAVLVQAGGAIAAEEVVLRYQAFSTSVDTADLVMLTETGETSSDLAAQLRMAGQNPEEMSTALTNETEVNPRLLDWVLNGPAGDVLLDEVGRAIHTRSRRANRQALRAAMTLSAQDDGKVSLLEIIQKYPNQQVYVDGDYLVSAYNTIASVQQQASDLLERIGVDGWGIF
jgi:Alpha/beta hydrolase of unknown function (DUF1400)